MIHWGLVHTRNLPDSFQCGRGANFGEVLF